MFGKKHNISAYLFVLFIALISMSDTYAGHRCKNVSVQRIHWPRISIVQDNQKSFTCNLSADDNDVPERVKLRVRYKASYCECTLTPPLVIQHSFYYVAPIDFVTPEYRIAHALQSGLQLRGPPAVFC